MDKIYNDENFSENGKVERGWVLITMIILLGAASQTHFTIQQILLTSTENHNRVNLG